MFTWLQTVMQRHYKWLFSGLLVVIIVAFVFTIGNTGGLGSGNHSNSRREFYGYDLNSPKDMGALAEATAISAFLMNRNQVPSHQSAAMQQRAVALYLADQMQIPAPNDEALARFFRQIPAFRDPQTGAFSRSRYTEIIENAENNPKLGLVLIEDYRITQVLKGLGGVGYVLPYLAVRELEQLHTQWTIDVATMPSAIPAPETEPSLDALKAFYQQNSFRYETSPQIVVSYVAFPTADFINAVQAPTNTQLTTYYNANRAQWPKTENGKATPLDSIRNEVTDAWKNDQAKAMAITKANELVVATFEASDSGALTFNPDAITSFLREQDAQETPLPPFPRDAPGSLDNTDHPFINDSTVALATSLDTRRFYTDAIPSDQGAVVLFFKTEIPASLPPFETIRAQVTVDYREAESRQQRNAHIRQTKEALKAALNAGEPFQQATRSLNLTVERYADFSIVTPPPALDPLILPILQNLNEGELSTMTGFNEPSPLVYVEKKTIPHYASNTPEVLNTMKQLAPFYSLLTAQGVINNLIIYGGAQLK